MREYLIFVRRKSQHTRRTPAFFARHGPGVLIEPHCRLQLQLGGALELLLDHGGEVSPMGRHQLVEDGQERGLAGFAMANDENVDAPGPVPVLVVQQPLLDFGGALLLDLRRWIQQRRTGVEDEIKLVHRANLALGVSHQGWREACLMRQVLQLSSRQIKRLELSEPQDGRTQRSDVVAGGSQACEGRGDGVEQEFEVGRAGAGM